MAKMNLTAERLREILDYDPETGLFTRTDAVIKGHSYKKGDKAGYLCTTGYIKHSIHGGYYMAHRLVWLHVYGKWPTNIIDHINGNPSDNRLCNLREVTVSQNAQNQKKAQIDNTTGFLGVIKSGKHRYKAVININGKYCHLGTFDTPEIAHNEYIHAKRKYHSACTI